MTTIGGLLKDARQKAQLTSASLAEKASLSAAALRRLERSSGNLTSLIQLLQALNLELRGRNLPPAKHLGSQLARLRKRRGLSQREICLAVNTSQPTLIALERRFSGRIDLLDKVARHLGAGLHLASPGERKTFFVEAGNASVFHEWQTPKHILESLYQVFDIFDLDPCSPTSNLKLAPVRARMHYTAEDDGLSLPWKGKVFLNPPYGRVLNRWVEKSRLEAEQGNCETVVALIPARTDTAWWHDHVAGKAYAFLIRGRLRFGDGKQSAPFPSALVVWGIKPVQVRKMKTAFPDAAMVRP